MASSDIDLVACSLREDHDAFAELVRRYQSPLRAWLRRLTDGDGARSDDLAQETFLRAYRRLGAFMAQGNSPLGYLALLTLNFGTTPGDSAIGWK